MIRTSALLLLGFWGLALPAISQQNPPAAQAAPPAVQQSQVIIDKAVKHCVEFVHQFPDRTNWTTQRTPVFLSISIFYNSATGRVENNGYLNGDIPVQYQFNKCMASQGLPSK